MLVTSCVEVNPRVVYRALKLSTQVQTIGTGSGDADHGCTTEATQSKFFTPRPVPTNDNESK